MRAPGSFCRRPRNRLMTVSALTPRSSSGLSWICMKLELLPPRPPA
ncbi:Uncharacterised protein [Bordetella pertussis]|nr:Uncharacterised protein [Bordetella pertussis]CFW45126.1 Uncharacterised protein [Bordetella pertussis]